MILVSTKDQMQYIQMDRSLKMVWALQQSVGEKKMQLSVFLRQPLSSLQSEAVKMTRVL